MQQMHCIIILMILKELEFRRDWKLPETISIISIAIKQRNCQKVSFLMARMRTAPCADKLPLIKARRVLLMSRATNLSIHRLHRAGKVV